MKLKFEYKKIPALEMEGGPMEDTLKKLGDDSWRLLYICRPKGNPMHGWYLFIRDCY